MISSSIAAIEKTSAAKDGPPVNDGGANVVISAFLD